MNTPITRLFIFFMVLFGLLIGSTTYWTVVRADELNNDHPSQNRRGLVRGLKVKRGVIRADDGTVLARSVRRDDGTYTRRYPAGGLFAHAVGYSFLASGQQTGLEAQYDEQLRGKRTDVESIVDELRGRSDAGDRLQTNLSPAAQRAALAGLAGRRGAVVALDPRDGAVKVLASLPGFNPNALRQPKEITRLNQAEGSPLFNRTTQSGYPPGSTFKVVAAIAAIDSGEYSPDTQVDGKSPIVVSGKPLANNDDEQFGIISLTTALTYSVNTVWAKVGEKLGPATMNRYLKRLGFAHDPPLDLPSGEKAASGLNTARRLIRQGDDIGRIAIGQGPLLVTPMQMAMVAASVANGGKLMQPQLAKKIVDTDGRTVDDLEPKEFSRVMSEDTARKVTTMMSKVVEEGTGQAVQLPGISVAGKTGTAQVGAPGTTQPWFIAFAPVDNPTVAIAVTVEKTFGGFGGTVAAPIARDVIQVLLREEQNR